MALFTITEFDTQQHKNQQTDFAKYFMEDYRLTTAEILYAMPDHPLLLQSYIWQELDTSPTFPILKKFLNFWDRELDGKIRYVRVTSCKALQAGNWHAGEGDLYIH